MSVELNHTIVDAYDRDASAAFLAGFLGVEPGAPTGPFRPITLANRVTLDFMQAAEVRPQHYAFLVGDEEFDAAYQRLQRHGIEHWADPGHTQAGINHRFGGRGVYFSDPNGHNMELLTKAG